MERDPLHEYALVVPREVRERGHRRRWLMGTLGAVLIGATAMLIVAPRKRLAAEFRTAPLEIRTITRVVEATGHVEVVTRTEVPAPAAGSLLQSLVHAGANV